MVYHAELHKGRWHQLSLMEQMGNIGSEVGRMIQRQKSAQSFQNEFERAAELIDLTKRDPRWHTFSRLKELARLKEVLVAAAEGTNEYNTSLEDIDQYLFQFAYAARLKK